MEAKKVILFKNHGTTFMKTTSQARREKIQKTRSTRKNRLVKNNIDTYFQSLITSKIEENLIDKEKPKSDPNEKIIRFGNSSFRYIKHRISTTGAIEQRLIRRSVTNFNSKNPVLRKKFFQKILKKRVKKKEKAIKKIGDFEKIKSLQRIKKDLIYSQYKAQAQKQDFEFSRKRLGIRAKENHKRVHLDDFDTFYKAASGKEIEFLEKKILYEEAKNSKQENRFKRKLGMVRVKMQAGVKLGEVLFRNREILMKDGLTKAVRYALRRENLLAIQAKFYEVIEKNPAVFKCPLLVAMRKKAKKESLYMAGGGDSTPSFIEFEPELSEKLHHSRAKLVRFRSSKAILVAFFGLKFSPFLCFGVGVMADFCSQLIFQQRN